MTAALITLLDLAQVGLLVYAVYLLGKAAGRRGR